MKDSQDVTTVKICSKDWIKITSAVLSVAGSILAAAVVAHVSYEKRFTKIETRQDQIVKNLDNLVETKSTLVEVRATVSGIAERIKRIEHKLDKQ